MTTINFGTKHADCNAHILRHLKGVDDFTKHIWSKDMVKLLQEILHQKNLSKLKELII